MRNALIINAAGIAAPLPLPTAADRPPERWGTIARQPEVLQVIVGPGLTWGHQWTFSQVANGPLLDLRVYQAAEFRACPIGSDVPAFVWTLASGEITLTADDPELGVINTVTVQVNDTSGISAPPGLYEFMLSLGELPGVADEPALLGNLSLVQEP